MDTTATKRVIALIDMDCFYCQVELRLNPSLAGKPVAVVQYNQWKQGGIIAVNYEARDKGVTRFMRGEDAKKACPEVELVSVPCVRGKADLSKYRDAGAEVAAVFASFSDFVERASVDEAFIDLTTLVEQRIRSERITLDPEKFPTTFVVGYSDKKSNDVEGRMRGTTEWLQNLRHSCSPHNEEYRLAVGALIVEEIRSQVLKKTGFHCSAGIGHNKILAKFVAGLHKPKCQTVLPHDYVPELYEDLPVKKVRNLGGKFGRAVCSTLSISSMSELYNFTKEELIEKFNTKNGTWLYEIARGIDHDPVTPRMIPDSIGCSKNFPGPAAIRTKEKLMHWLTDMAREVVERLEKDQRENARVAKLLTISFRTDGNSSSRSCPLSAYKVENIAKDAFEILSKFNQSVDSKSWYPVIENLGLSASKFTCQKNSIRTFFKDKETSKPEIKSDTLKLEEQMAEEIKVFEEMTAIPEINLEEKLTEKVKTLEEMTELPSLEPSEPFVTVDTPENNMADSQDSHEHALPAKSFFSRILAQKESTEPSEPQEIEPEPTTSSDSDWYQTCTECGEKLHLSLYFEHVDFHAALKLDKAINGSSVPVKSVLIKKQKMSPKSKKRKLSRPVNQPDIAAFFSTLPK